MEKQLPKINDEPIVHEYISMLLDNDKKKEYKDTEELLQYIAGMEKQFEEVVKELHDVKELLNSLQNPTTKMRLSSAIDKVQISIDNGKNKLNKIKVNLISSMKECLASFKEKGKEGIVKTINVLHFREALKGIRSSLFDASFKMDDVVRTCDLVTSEMRKSKNHFRNAGRLLMGRPVQYNSSDKIKLNAIQKCSRVIVSKLDSMDKSVKKMINRIDSFEKSSVRSELHSLKDNSKTQGMKIHEKKEQSR